MARSHTKMASLPDAQHRLRVLQSLLSEETDTKTPEAILFVCGVDGKDNWASSAVIRWLCLGESGRGLIDERPRPFDGPPLRTLDDAARDAAADALEETAIIVTRRALAVLYDPAARSLLAPLLASPACVERSLDPATVRNRRPRVSFKVVVVVARAVELSATLDRRRTTRTRAKRRRSKRSERSARGSSARGPPSASRRPRAPTRPRTSSSRRRVRTDGTRRTRGRGDAAGRRVGIPRGR